MILVQEDSFPVHSACFPDLTSELLLVSPTLPVAPPHAIPELRLVNPTMEVSDASGLCIDLQDIAASLSALTPNNDCSPPWLDLKANRLSVLTSAHQRVVHVNIPSESDAHPKVELACHFDLSEGSALGRIGTLRPFRSRVFSPVSTVPETLLRGTPGRISIPTRWRRCRTLFHACDSRPSRADALVRGVPVRRGRWGTSPLSG